MSPIIESMQQYPQYLRKLDQCSDQKKTDHLRVLLRTDLYFLLRYGCKRKDMENQWLFDRCREVQASPNGHLDLWAREHYKSTIITFGKTLQDILASHGEDPLPEWEKFPEPTFGIFSHTRPIAKGFLRQIKVEMETNVLLKTVFPDILFADPQGEAATWSEDGGLVVKRKSNPKESTLEAHGLVDGQPTSKHFVVRIYDDVVTEKSVTTPEMIKKVTSQWGLSLNLGVDGGIERYAGTRYRHNDTYKVIAEHVPIRKYAATEDGNQDGEPVFRSKEWIADKKRAGSYTFACQQLLDPQADSLMSFSEDDLMFYLNTPTLTNNYILCDPANSKKKTSDYTTFWVIGCGPDDNYYALYMLKDRLGLTERADVLFDLHRQFKPLAVAYEQYGMQADIDHFKDRMERDNYRFTITPVGGQMAKDDRVLRLTPLFEQRRVWMPRKCAKMMRDGTLKDMVQAFINDEYLPFPVGIHPDFLDSLSRILDIPHKFPKTVEVQKMTFRRAV